MFYISAEKLLPDFEHLDFTGMAYDGRNFYFTSGERYIYTLNMSGEWEQPLQTRRAYHSIYFDYERTCFWAVSRHNPGYVYQLSTNFVERGHMLLHNGNYHPGQIHAITLAPDRKNLLCLCTSRLYTVDMNGNCEAVRTQESDRYFSSCIQINQCDEGLLMLHRSTDGLSIRTFSLEMGQCVESLELTDQIKYAMFTMDTQADSKTLFLYGQNQDNQPIICEYEHEQESDKKVEEAELMASNASSNLEQLVYNIMPELAGTQMNGCNKHSASTCCPPKCSPKKCCPKPCKCDCNSNCACVAVLESIASVECSIAHILNAEGEKLQKAIKKADCIEDLLKINQSVKETIIHSTHLEQVLYSKLELALDQCPMDQKPICH